MTFHRYHREHHRLLGVDRDDTDLPLPLEVAHVGTRPLRKLAWLATYFVVYALRGATFAKAPDRREIANAVLMLIVDAVLVVCVGPVALAYLFLSLFFAHSLHPLAAHYVHEHYTFRDGQETFSYYGPLNHVTFNVGYHVEHHDFANVPGWRLPALRRIAARYYEGLESHTSWIGVLVEFVTRPSFGVGSRIVRSREDFARGRRKDRTTTAPGGA
jgi:sphingolipid delta-4 desaturase